MDYLIFSVTTRSIAQLWEQVLPVLDPGMVSPHQIPEAMGTQPRVLPAPMEGSVPRFLEGSLMYYQEKGELRHFRHNPHPQDSLVWKAVLHKTPGQTQPK